MLDKFSQIAKIIGVVVTIVVLFITWREYEIRYEQSKVNRSFQFYDRFRSGELLKVRANHHIRISESRKKTDDSGSPLRGNELANEIIETLTQNRASIDLDIVLEFFDAAYKCSELGGCDRKTVINLLGDEANHLLRLLCPVIKHRVRLNSDYGIGLKCIATIQSSEIVCRCGDSQVKHYSALCFRRVLCGSLRQS